MRKPLKTWKSFASLEEVPSTRGQIEVEYKQVAILRLCLVAVKCFPENTYFPEMLISGKGKYFSVFGCISKNFPENIFWCLEKKNENTNPRKIPSTIAIWDRDLAGASSRRREIAIDLRSRPRDGTISRRRSRSQILSLKFLNSSSICYFLLPL